MAEAAARRAGQAYEWKGRTGPFTLLIPPEVFIPSSTSKVLADALEIGPGETVADIGCGSGVLSLVAARLGAGRVVGCDSSPDAVACAQANAQRLGLAGTAEFRSGHLAGPLDGLAPDVVIADVSGVPDVVAAAAGWFPDGRGGGPTGSELPAAMLADIAARLPSAGRVYLPTGTIQDERRVLAAARAAFGDSLRQVAQRVFPLPQDVTQRPDVAEFIESGAIPLERRGARYTWRLTVWEARSGARARFP